MQEKFKKVIDEYSKFYVVIGDDELIHDILEKCNVSIEELLTWQNFLQMNLKEQVKKKTWG